MRKIILFIIAALITSICFSQSTLLLRADTVKVYKVGDSAELVLENATRHLTGSYLKNRWNGRTEFEFAVDSGYLSGSDLILWRGDGNENLTIDLSSLGGAETDPDSWHLLGNAGTTPGTHFLGTTDNQDLVFKVNNTEAGRLNISTTSVFLGLRNVAFTSTGIDNVGIGWFALQNNTTGTDNVAIGENALSANTTGYYNTAVGQAALQTNTTGFQNAAFGEDALQQIATGEGNVALGTEVMRLATSGNYNTGGGFRALYVNAGGSYNIAYGMRTLEDNTNGSYNAAIGFNTLGNNTGGDFNIGIGREAGLSLINGDYNIFIGDGAGNNASQKVNSINSIVIGKNAYTTTDSTLVLGSANLNKTEIFGDSLYFKEVPTGPGVYSLRLDADGKVTYADTTTGGGTPGGADTQVQFNDGGVFGGDANFLWDDTNDRLTVGQTSAGVATLTLSKNNTDYTNTSGAGSVLHLKNPNASGQTVVYSEINGAMAAKWRTDNVANINWISAANNNNYGHNFFIAGDYPGGSIKLTITNTGSAFGTWTGVTPSIPTATLTVFGTTILNEAGTDSDTRIEGDTDPNLLLADASTDELHIGGSSDLGTGKLQVHGKVQTTGGILKRTSTEASAATPTINTDNVDFHSITALAVDITSMTTNLSGTPSEGQTLWIAITGTAARAIAWGASFEASTVPLPTTTVGTDRLDVGFIWNTATSKWRVVAAQ